MAAIRKIFQAGVETIFSVFNEAVKIGVLTQSFDDGFGTSSSSTDSVRCIFETFTEKDITLLSFAEMIQPKDVKGLMPSVDLVNCEMTTKGRITFAEGTYTVEGYDLDPLDVIYTLLLRKV